jgi:ATP-dependent Lon protease
MAYAVEGRRRVKEQMNKRKADDEFASIGLSYFDPAGNEVVVHCPESKDAPATQNPSRRTLAEMMKATGASPGAPPVAPAPARPAPVPPPAAPAPAPLPAAPAAPPPAVPVLKEKHIRIGYGDTGFTYESLFGDYLKGAKEITVEDPYIRVPHQISNFLRFCELVVKIGTAQVINLTTGSDDATQRKEAEEKLKMIGASLLDHGIKLNIKFSDTLHDREIRLDNGWTIQIGRGFDIYQKLDNWFSIGTSDLEMRPCMETRVDVFRG